MIRFLAGALALTAALPAMADGSVATVDGRQISYNATSSDGAARTVQRPLSRDDVLGMLRNARPVTPSATLPTDTLDGSDNLPQRP